MTIPLGGALGVLGTAAVPAARPWADTAGHPMRVTALGLLADHGDESDIPRLPAAWDPLDGDPDQLCGYDRPARGCGRIGGDLAHREVPARLRRWDLSGSYRKQG